MKVLGWNLSLDLQCRRRLPDYLQEKCSIRLEQFGDAFLADVRDDDLPNLGVHVR
jgi:hypothetical protein